MRPERARRSVPALRLDGLRGCGVYQDSWTHDGRLCLANVTAAAEAGATVLSYAEVVGLRMVDGVVCGAELRDRLSSEEISVEARAVVNATGPWLDELRRLEDPGRAAVRSALEGRPRDPAARGAMVVGSRRSRTTRSE